MTGKLEDRMNRFLSFGGGVQTTALLLMRDIVPFDEVVFADTGNEWPGTYEYMEKWSKPYCEEHSIPFISVRNSDYDSLEDMCLQKKITPSRLQRWCTDKAKIRPIRKYVKEHLDGKAVAVMGISFDEYQRMHDPHWNEYTFEYPLIERHITREMCKDIIRKHGWPVPPKSGCWFCPFQRAKQWKELYQTEPLLYKRAITIEENSSGFPEFHMIGDRSLRSLASKFGDGTKKLEEFGLEYEENECGGNCML